VLRRTLVVLLLGGVLAAGCGASRHETRWFSLTERYEPHGDFYASVLIRVDPITLQPLNRRGLRLGDAATSRVFSPDGRTLALGGTNFGQIAFVDLSRPTKTTRLTVAPEAEKRGVEIEVHEWPRRARLVAVATDDGVWWAPHPSRLLIVDPQRRRVVRRMSLRGTVLSSVSLLDGTTALLIANARFPTVVIVRPDGSIWRKHLRRLGLGGRDGVRVRGVYYKPERDPALATDGHERIFIVVSDRPIAEVRPHSNRVTYHLVHLSHRYLSSPPPSEPGTGGVHLRFSASATWLDNDQLAIGGLDELPGRLPVGIGHGDRQRALEIVDTRTWKRTKTIPAFYCRRVPSVTLCAAATGGFPPDGKGTRGPSLVAYDPQWRPVYDKRSPQLWWSVTGGRLLAGSADGRTISELDPESGHVIRRIRPAPLANDMWPLDLISWTPHCRHRSDTDVVTPMCGR
jgi:hypothetical protein